MADSGFGKVLMFGAVGIGAWYLYENWASLFGAAASTPGTGSSTPPVASGSTSTTGSGSSAGTGSGTPPTPANSITAAFWASLFNLLRLRVATAQSQGDPAVTLAGTTLMAAPDVFNYYFAQVFPAPPSNVTYAGTAGWPPDVNVVFPGVDRTQPMSISTYWAGLSGYLASNTTANAGVSGLGLFAGLGCFRQQQPRRAQFFSPDPPMSGGYVIQ